MVVQRLSRENSRVYDHIDSRWKDWDRKQDSTRLKQIKRTYQGKKRNRNI